MQLLNKLRGSTNLTAYLQIVLGCVIGGAAYPWFLTPHSIAPGGLTGVATILNYLFQWPIGTVSLIMNIPLFIIGWRSMGRSFAFRTLFATVLFSLCIDFLPLEPLTQEPLLATLFGGVLLGAGLGFIMRGGASTGGTDMIARMVHHRLPFISTGAFLFAIDCVVVLAAGITMGMSEALYALISIYVCAKVMDVVMMGITTRKACYIITPKWKEVEKQILFVMDRGATELLARGAYSQEERPVLLCVVNSQEIQQIKRIVHATDESAFMIITDAYEALGEGFSSLGAED